MVASAFRTFVQLLIILKTIFGYSMYQTKIPNGAIVKNPCHPGDPWPGIGHKNPAGGGPRNPFGIDFGLSNQNWSAVCHLDSDGDGKTNGQELGDPSCEWTPGHPPPNITAVSHPGICEPMSSPVCKERNSWFNCSSAFNCAAIQSSDVLNFTLRFPPTQVPAAETTYNCYGFMLPNMTTDYHIIALEPLIESSAVVHHMLLYVCINQPTNTELFNGVQRCEMNPQDCNQLIGLWSIGIGGQCLPDAYGYRIGLNGYRYALMQIHYNNPQSIPDYIDSSGMTVYYSPNLRPNDGIILTTGQINLNIPPQLSSYKVQGTCSKHCTSALTRPIKLSSSFLHMHLLGKSGSIDLIRNGITTNLASVPYYDYNSPSFLTYDVPFELQPGDEIRTTCEFNSMARTDVTMYGPSTTDEMCFSFISYYPADEKFSTCVQWRSASSCSNVGLECDTDTLSTMLIFSQYACGICSKSCRVLLQGIADSGCFDGDIGLMLNQYSIYKSVSEKMMECQITKTTPCPTVTTGDNQGSSKNKKKRLRAKLAALRQRKRSQRG